MKKRIFAILLIILIIIAIYWLPTINWQSVFNQLPNQNTSQADNLQNGAIIGSGSIEAETIIISAETRGRILQVHVNEGDEVKADQVLVTLDSTLLLAQQAELEAAITTAKTNLANVMSGPQTEEIAVAEAELAQIQTQRDSAYKIWQQSLQLVEDPQEFLLPIQDLQAQIKQTEGLIELAQATTKEAAIQEEAASRNQSSHAALVNYEIAKKQHQATALGIKMAQAQHNALQIQLAHLWTQYNNPIIHQVQANQAESAYRIAQSAVILAQTKLNVTKAEPTPRRNFYS